MASSTPSSPQQSFAVLGVFVLIVGALFWAQEVIIPLALAFLLTFLLSPLVAALQRRGFRRVPAVLVVVVLVFTLLGGVAWAVTVQVRDLANTLPSYQKNIEGKITSLRSGGPGVIDRLTGLVLDIEQQLKQPSEEEKRADAEATTTGPEPQRVIVVADKTEKPSGFWFASLLAPVLHRLATAGLVVILVIFMLLWREDLRNRMIRLVGHGRLTSTTKALDDATHRISSFLLMQLVINAGFGACLAVGLALVGLPYALLWGFLAGVLRFIPYIGTWVAALLPITLSVAYFPSDDWLHPLLVLGAFVVLELVTYNAVEPLLFSHSTGLSPVALLMATAFWTWLWGPIGLVLATPLTTCLVVLGKHVPHMEFLDVLLGDEPALATGVTYYQRLLARDQDEATDLVEDHLKEHPFDDVFDDVLLPSLTLAKRDREEGDLSAENERFVHQATREVLDDLVTSRQQIHRIATGKGDAPSDDGAEKVLVYCCPAHDSSDELAATMFRQLLETTRCQVEVLPTSKMTSEVVALVKEKAPALLFIAALPPGGLAQTRYLCKRLRAQFPDLKIAVCRWGQTEGVEKMAERLRAAGANLVATTLRESRDQVLPYVQVAKHLNVQSA